MFLRSFLCLLSPWSVAIGAMMIFSLASCSDFGERDNPYDPVSGNFNAALWWPSSSSDWDSSATTVTQKYLWTYKNLSVNYGMAVDKRDQIQYLTIVISKKTWFAENLNYGSLGVCYDNDEELCEKYGRLYTWDEAKNACPSGYRLPTKAEWDDVGSAVSMMTVKGWALDSGKVGGEDVAGFSLMPAGYATASSSGNLSYEGISTDAMLWTSTESVGDSAYGIHVFDMKKMTISKSKKQSYLSVRCVR